MVVDHLDAADALAERVVLVADRRGAGAGRGDGRSARSAPIAIVTVLPEPRSSSVMSPATLVVNVRVGWPVTAADAAGCR
ncbi:MAG: hypothetical protein U1F37_14050 [Alphaproteobacteria bacterium]